MELVPPRSTPLSQLLARAPTDDEVSSVPVVHRTRLPPRLLPWLIHHFRQLHLDRHALMQVSRAELAIPAPLSGAHGTPDMFSHVSRQNRPKRNLPSTLVFDRLTQLRYASNDLLWSLEESCVPWGRSAARPPPPGPPSVAVESGAPHSPPPARGVVKLLGQGRSGRRNERRRHSLRRPALPAPPPSSRASSVVPALVSLCRLRTNSAV